jgi:putative DNA primase/helicase
MPLIASQHSQVCGSWEAGAMVDRFTDAMNTMTHTATVELSDLRLSLAGNGYRPVPISGIHMSVKSPGKQPVMSCWQQRCTTADEKMIRSWSAHAPDCTNTGVLTGISGGIVAADIDVLIPEVAAEIANLASELLGATPLQRIGRAPKILCVYRVGEDFGKMKTPTFIMPDGSEAAVEFLAEGQQFVAFGTHPTGKPYQWVGRSPVNVPVDELPLVDLDAAKAFVDCAEQVLRDHGGVSKQGKGKATIATASKPANGSAAPVGENFFVNVNSAALADPEPWMRSLFGNKVRLHPGTGAYRVRSEELGRNLEEDISVHPQGVCDFGLETSVSPIDLAVEHGGVPDALQAALWLCEQLQIDPALLGWKRTKKPEGKTADCATVAAMDDGADKGGEPDEDNRRTRPPIPLGYDHGQYFYLAPMTHQVVALRANQHTKLELMALADTAHFWERQNIYKNGKGKSGTNWDAAAADLMEKCSQVGPYNPDRIRGRGAWIDQGKAVLHMGQHLVVDGAAQPLALADSKFVYEAALSMNQAVAEAIRTAQAAELAEICKLLRWEKPISGTLMAGWLVVAPICGALRWRPSIWVTGSSGSGKSTLETRVVRPVLGGIGQRVQGGTTEAGIRQLLGMDARPVVFDEAEAENTHSKARIQSILDLVRQSSSEGGAEIIKGSQGQNGVKRYHIRSCFMFSSINVSLDHLADESRVTVLELRSPPPHDVQAMADFDTLLKRIDATMTPDFCAGLVARSVKMIPTILANAATFARAVASHLGSSRVGDQIGTLLAGAYALHSDREISPTEAREYVERRDWDDTTSAEADPDDRRMLGHLMQRRVRLDVGDKLKNLTLAELVRLAAGENGEAMATCANNELKRHGMAWDGAKNGVWVSNTHTALKEHLAGTPWSSQWARTLRRLPDAEPLARDAPAIRFAGLRSRATLIPLVLIG